MIDLNAALNPKMAMIIFGAAAMGGFLINRSMKLIIGSIIAISVATILFVIASQNPYIHLDEEVSKRILEKFYYPWKDKPKMWLDAVLHAQLANFELQKTYKPLIGLAGFGFGFAFLGKIFGEPKPPKPKKK